MNMRDKKRAVLARAAGPWVIPTTEATEILAALTQVREARVALLRRPGALIELRARINAMRGPSRKVLRKMLAEDLKLMRLLDRKKARALAANT